MIRQFLDHLDLPFSHPYHNEFINMDLFRDLIFQELLHCQCLQFYLCNNIIHIVALVLDLLDHLFNPVQLDHQYLLENMLVYLLQH